MSIGPVALIILAVFILLAGLIILVLLKLVQRLGRVRDELLQEKDVIYGFIHDIGEVFADVDDIDLELMLNRVLFYAMRTTRAGSGAVYLFDADRESLRARALSGIFPPLMDVDQSLKNALSRSKHIEHLVRTRLIKRGEGLVGEVAEHATSLLIEDAERDPRVPQYDIDFLQIDSILAVPMRFHRKVLGVMVVLNRVDGQPFNQGDQNLLQSLADQASISIHYAGQREALAEKQRIDHDLNVAKKIQGALLPAELPHVEGVELAAFNEPALEIGGDYYDFVTVDDEHIGIAIADVSGKGVGGAIMMSICRSVLHAHAPGNKSPVDVLNSINRAMDNDISEDMFVSMLYMILNTRTRELIVARAGHERPILRSGEGSGFSVIESPGMAIGIADSESFEAVLQEVRISLKAGDSVVAYTDGVTEAMNHEGEEWGVDNFLNSLSVATEEGVESIMDNVRQRLGRFVGDQPQYDDMTLLAIRVLR